MLEFCLGFVAALVVIFIWKGLVNRSFGLSEELLNLTPPNSHWGNLGYWKDTSDYAKACQQLADVVAHQAGLDDESDVMDVGFGCGDQLLLWHQKYGVKTISGVNCSHDQMGLAQRKLRQAEVTAFLHHYDHTALNHHPERNFTHVLSVDAAYFFHGRDKWFKQVHRVLKPSGKMVVTDLVMPDQPVDLLQAFFMACALRLCGIPKENIITLEEYKAQLKQAGFHAVSEEDISECVMDGFAHWLPSYQAGFAGIKTFPIWQKYRGTARILAWLRKHDLIRCYLICAQR